MLERAQVVGEQVRAHPELVLEIARGGVPEPEGIDDAKPAGVRQRSVQLRPAPPH